MSNGLVYVLPSLDGKILLPRQSHLGTFVGPQNQPTDIWPIKILCNENGRLYERSHDMIRREVYPIPDPSQRQVRPWMIAFRCARTDCGSLYTIFAIEYADDEGERHLRNALSKAALGLCKEHATEISQDTVQMWWLPY
jgi:hypothetical protein